MNQIRQFDVFWLNLDPTIGRENNKTRPCVIVSPDIMNDALDTVIVVPLTSTIIDWPFRVTVRVNHKKSSAACDHIKSVSKNRIQKKIGHLSAKEQESILAIVQEIFAN